MGWVAVRQRRSGSRQGESRTRSTFPWAAVTRNIPEAVQSFQAKAASEGLGYRN